MAYDKRKRFQNRSALRFRHARPFGLRHPSTGGTSSARNTYGSLREVLEAVCRDFGATLVEMNGGDDHMHLLVEYPPKIAVCSLVNSLKGVSSRLAKKRHPELARRYWKRALWTPSYFAAS